MSKRHRRTLAAILTEPPPANVRWDDVESLLSHLGATIEEAGGSRVRVILGGVATVFHRPHPRKEASRPQLRSVAAFLVAAGVA